MMDQLLSQCLSVLGNKPSMINVLYFHEHQIQSAGINDDKDSKDGNNKKSLEKNGRFKETFGRKIVLQLSCSCFPYVMISLCCN